ncbi:hypothetical protein AK812_SmicGene29703 [Symbiodinium microadriaticum]|uniref:Uncharacterized protein n=1 Tax=Symbiodinium microadriaticum TaxID=2951 RepID=A0A1Q9D129_SYMMI|nr:hypothetical protein AK812_SmicGene29703 [Symbiodinium microadriaticum]
MPAETQTLQDTSHLPQSPRALSDVTNVDAYQKNGGAAQTSFLDYNNDDSRTGMDRITHQPDVASRDACEEMCNREDSCREARTHFQAKTICETILLDTPNATIEGEWTASRSVPGFTGRNYLLDRTCYTPYPNRASNVPIVITQGGQATTIRVNQKQGREKLLGKYTFAKGDTVKLATYGVDGKVVADALYTSWKKGVSCAVSVGVRD